MDPQSRSHFFRHSIRRPHATQTLSAWAPSGVWCPRLRPIGVFCQLLGPPGQHHRAIFANSFVLPAKNNPLRRLRDGSVGRVGWYRIRDGVTKESGRFVVSRRALNRKVSALRHVRRGFVRDPGVRVGQRLGAAVAVALGASGLVAVNAASNAPSSFVSITPTRILDTRTDVGLHNPFVSGVPQTMQITGTVATQPPGDTAPINAEMAPSTATPVALNVNMMRPSTKELSSIRPSNATRLPATSNINWAAAGANIANSVTMQLPRQVTSTSSRTAPLDTPSSTSRATTSQPPAAQAARSQSDAHDPDTSQHSGRHRRPSRIDQRGSNTSDNNPSPTAHTSTHSGTARSMKRIRPNCVPRSAPVRSFRARNRGHLVDHESAPWPMPVISSASTGLRRWPLVQIGAGPERFRNRPTPRRIVALSDGQTG
ncbi:MAG: hypothetical protein ACJAXA_002937 [Candidatus Aldehydirespiratoraceae bacterium]|jgi:hypothetical protein